LHRFDARGLFDFLADGGLISGEKRLHEFTLTTSHEGRKAFEPWSLRNLGILAQPRQELLEIAYRDVARLDAV